MGTTSGSCTGSSLWARARAARSGSRRGCESEHPLLARYFTSRASRLRLALGDAALAALAAAGSRSGLVLGTRARYSARSGSYSYSYLGLAVDRTLGRCDRNNPVALRAFRIQQPALAIGGLVLYALHAVGPRVGRPDAVDGEPTRHSRPPMPAPWTKRGRRQREAREDRGGDRADRSRGEEGGNAPRRSDRTLDDSKRRRNARHRC